MKNHLLTIVLAMSLGYAAGYLGGLSSQPATEFQANNDSTSDDTYKTSDQIPVNLLQFELLKYQVERLQQQLDEIKSAGTPSEAAAENSNPPDTARTQTSFAAARPVEPNQDDLLAAGVPADQASQLLRRISQQNYRRLELQNLIRRYPDQAAQYRNELRELNQNRISLRSELDETSYDKYLYHSGQNNRVEVSSVMAGSPAESAGFSAGDIILSYDNKKILGWTDIRQATQTGDINSYTNVNVLRNGERITLTVPRGTLGVQLNPLQMDPAAN